MRSSLPVGGAGQDDGRLRGEPEPIRRGFASRRRVVAERAHVRRSAPGRRELLDADPVHGHPPVRECRHLGELADPVHAARQVELRDLLDEQRRRQPGQRHHGQERRRQGPLLPGKADRRRSAVRDPDRDPDRIPRHREHLAEERRLPELGPARQDRAAHRPARRHRPPWPPRPPPGRAWAGRFRQAHRAGRRSTSSHARRGRRADRSARGSVASR